jgi:hypothetical protein
MKNIHRSLRVKKMRLSARVAAANLVLYRGAKPPAWRALPLFWRRSPKWSRVWHPVRTPTQSAVWVPQVQLHFSVRIYEEWRAFSSPARARLNMARPVPQCFMVSRDHPTTRVFSATHPVRVYRTAVRVYQIKRPAFRVSTLRVVPLRMALLGYQKSICNSVYYFEESRQRRVISETEKSFVCRIPTSTLVKPGYNAPNLRSRVPRKVGTPKSAIQFHGRALSVRTPELIWHRAPQAPASIVEAPPNLESSPNAPGVFRSRRPAEETAVTEPSRAYSPAHMNQSMLDPEFVDRLTDDVIRRVERRVRIERERRGL